MTQDHTQHGSRLGRRSLVRAGVVSAWTIPVVHVVTAGPAFAGTTPPPPADISGSTFGGFSRSGTTIYTGQFVVSNAAGSQPTSDLTMSIVNNQGKFASPPPAAPAGWRLVGSTEYTVQYAPTAQVPGGGSLSFAGLALQMVDTSTVDIVISAHPGPGSYPKTFRDTL